MGRYLGESPANLCTPAYVAAAAQSIAEAAPDVMRLEVHRPSDVHCQWACKDGTIANVCELSCRDEWSTWYCNRC
jgi:hypothetical protein